MALDTTQLRTGREPPRQAPRFSGDPAGDSPAIQEWMKQIIASLLNSGLGDPLYQYAPAEIDPANLPDPTLTTISRAQATANLALKLLADHIAAQDQTIAALTARVAALEGP